MPAKSAKDRCYSVWPTAWGPVGGVWGDRGLRRFVLPHYQRDDLEQLLAWEHPSAVPDDQPFGEFAALSQAYFSGEIVEFADVPCELPGGFAAAVYALVRTIGYGRTLSYGDVAKRMDREDAARAVATALGRNPVPLVVPCHRVTYADGSAGGFSAPGGVELKGRMIRMEREKAQRAG